ncbi:MAG: hypothetical protein B7Z75_03155 [Acidocella sp. 20-57-95]|nr:MAG: hypothetical protein B7Z75_03155 [Acidocella sp. 20-57-95]OYV60125.1 MAG: hypothetical protein B7Z71_06785 [Acidocella sp. 21-58-7]HQT64548.1 CHAD domain-containing protein [Acidocella sp.]HQU03954.1 CHAD domain-containing protein [Acidocella sp.]
MLDTNLVPVSPIIPLLKPINRELELKFLVSDSGFKASQKWSALGAAGRRLPSKRLRTVYFDTPRGDLQRHKMVLRMRGQRRGYMMTLKWSGGLSGGLFERGEIEIPTLNNQPDPALFGPNVAAMIADVIEDRVLTAVYETDIRRLTQRVQTATSDIEVAFDSGFIIAGSISRPIREIEMELKAGDSADLYRLGIALAEQYPVRLSSLAKSDRGAMLATGKSPEAARAKTDLQGNPTVDEAIAQGINGCLTQFAANWPAFEDGDQIGAVHQMRVAMRRLRAMLGLFHHAFPAPEFLVFRAEAKNVAALMGEARNLDVFLNLLRQGPVAAFPNEPGFAAILADCERRRAAAYETVRALLAAPSTTRFVLSVQAFVARYGWRNALSGEALPRLTAPAQDFASQNLARLHNKLLKRGKHLATLAPHDRHQLRIDLKKLRYAADLFGPLFPSKSQTRAYLKAAAALQDELGRFNDLITATETVSHLTGNDTRAAGIILGWCSHSATADDAKLSDTWRAFRKSRLFWG